MKKFIVILLWWIGLCGILGLHRFYLGYKITGYIWLFTFGGFLLGSLYDIGNIDRLIAESEGKVYEPVEEDNRSTKQQSNYSENKNMNNQNKRIQYTEYTEVHYRIGGIGRTLMEIIYTNSEAEARSVMRAKYPGVNITVVSTRFIRRQI